MARVICCSKAQELVAVRGGQKLYLTGDIAPLLPYITSKVSYTETVEVVVDRDLLMVVDEYFPDDWHSHQVRFARPDRRFDGCTLRDLDWWAKPIVDSYYRRLIQERNIPHLTLPSVPFAMVYHGEVLITDEHRDDGIYTGDIVRSCDLPELEFWRGAEYISRAA